MSEHLESTDKSLLVASAKEVSVRVSDVKCEPRHKEGQVPQYRNMLLTVEPGQIFAAFVRSLTPEQ